MKSTDTPIRALSVAQAARALQVREARIREEIRSGRLRAARVGRLWRIPISRLDAYLDERLAEVDPPRVAAS